MAIDTTAVTRVGRPRQEVAAYLTDPANDPGWIGGLRSARLVTPPPVGVGSQVERVAGFYGFEDAGGGTEVSVRVQGDASRMYRLADPLLARLVRRSVQRDLRNLKRVLEGGSRLS